MRGVAMPGTQSVSRCGPIAVNGNEFRGEMQHTPQTTRISHRDVAIADRL